MEEEKSPPQTEFEDEVSDHILNLTNAFNSLMEVDSQLLSKQRQSKLAKMKRQIFNALVYYCDCLPEPEEPKAEEEE